jgi:hypothetical protein
MLKLIKKNKTVPDSGPMDIDEDVIEPVIEIK